MSSSNTKFMLSKVLSSKVFAASLIVGAVALSLMYYNTILGSTVASSAFPSPHSAAVSAWLGSMVALGVVSNAYVMKAVMSGGKEAMRAASRTALSMLAGAVGCVGSIASVFLSLGVGVGSGVLAFLSANILPFFAVALVMSLVSVKLAADTLAKASCAVKP